MSPVRHVTIKTRQVGLSTFWLLYWLDDTMLFPGTVSGILAHKDESIAHLRSILTIAISNFGKRMALKEDNQRRISFDNDSSILLSLEIRSTPLTNLHISEWCYCDNARIWATVGATSKWTNISGESTGNGIGNDGYLTYMDAKEGKGGYKSRFIPWFEHEEYTLPMNGMPYLLPDKRERDWNLTQEQIHFRRQMHERLKAAFFVEYPETEEDAFAQSGANVFNGKKIVVLAREARGLEGPVEQTDKYKIWELPQKGHVYVMGSDVSEGLGEGADVDYSAFKILCVTCRREAMAYKCRIGIDAYYRDIATFGFRYNTCLVGVERNNHGHAVILGLREISKYPNLFIEDEKRTRIIQSLKKEKPKPKYGWHTTTITKPLMIDQLKIAIEGDSEEDENTFQPEYTIYDTEFLNECLTFQKDGVKLGAISGKHDDTVIASAIALQMYMKMKTKLLLTLKKKGVIIGDQREYKT